MSDQSTPTPPNKRPPFEECIAIEKGDAPMSPGHDSPSARIRRLLLHGEVLSSEDAADAAGGSPGLLYAVVAAMKEWGFTFEVLKGPGPGLARRTRLRNPEHVPTARVPKGKRPYKKRKPAEEPKAAPAGKLARTPQQRGAGSHEMTAAHGEELEPAPMLDQSLKVYLVFRDPETNEVKVGLRNGTVSWLVTVEGHVPTPSAM